MDMTPEQLGVLQHALGLDKYGRGEMHRNHFCAGGDDERVCMELVEMGYMQVFHPIASPLPYYSVTEAGKGAVLRESPKPPKLTRSQKRYREFLKADTGHSFGEWIKDRSAAARR